MDIPFIKMHACGNDFLVIDNRLRSLNLTKEQITGLSDYKKSIGFDQLLLIEKSNTADVFMKIYNKDGSLASACGNGSRCIAKLILTELKKEQITIATKNRIIEAKWHNNLISINMGEADLIEDDLEFLNFMGSMIDIGNLHIVILVQDLAQIDINKYGPMIENDSRFSSKPNVNFVQVMHHNQVILRTWETGAGATLACGTGACASFYAVYKKGLLNHQAVIKQPGGEVSISLEDQNIIMTGEAQISYKGTFKLHNH
jgi:diaminopimelate epimerase